ncbi:MAG TPA: hemolysin III family protein [Candidatus Pacearchaeota archaeon]|nr:hemolysin III family protein [Candidatus Pacearchaeota archaeon]HPZ74328.1 hemolysin III family protein [Candidatus Pacearchaeota archaeon]HQD88933.1 hemolysin III family protein [Candidatus Pacearchaeota archaeon]
MALKIKIKDPVSGLSHLIGAVLSVFGTVILISSAVQEQSSIKIISFSVFGLSMIFLYASSTIYHLFGHSPEEIDIFRKIDHAMIYILIAGTYTPICLIPLWGPWGWYSLILIWALAIFGISMVFLKKFWTNVPRWVATAIYVVMGWLSVVLLYPLSQKVSVSFIGWLLLGGFFYTLGAYIYAQKKPNFCKQFGFHEIFHILTILGTFCHFWGIYNFII